MRSTGFSVIMGSWKIMAMREPAQPGESRLAGCHEIMTIEDDPARGDAARLVDQADDGKAGHRLAGPGFADQAEYLAAPQAQVNAVHGFHDPGPSGEFRVQPLDAQQFVAKSAHSAPPIALTVAASG